MVLVPRISYGLRGRRRVKRSRGKRKYTKVFIVRGKKKSSASKRHGKKIHYTKKGQPYVILPNGRARFIKKK